MPKTKKITVNDVMRKDLKVIGYLLVFGLTTYISQKYLQVGDLSIVFGGAVNFALFRLEKELKNEGYGVAEK